MLCDRCQTNEATIHIQEVIGLPGQQSNTLHLCPQCAAEQGILNTESGAVDLAAMIQDLSAGTLTAKTAPTDQDDPAAARTCPACGLTGSDFRTTGRLGCDHCYQTFSDLLAPLLKEVHRDVRHVGRRPDQTESGESPAPTEIDLPGLQQQLDRAIAAEAYERAAGLRDRIRRLQQSQESVRDP